MGAALSLRGLRVVLPDGRVLIEDLSLAVDPGEVLVVLGGSGAGKSTLTRVLFEPEGLARDGFEVTTDALALDRDELGLVPQRGALFDHLDVRENLELALRYARARDAGTGAGEAAAWLSRLGLDRALAEPGVPVSTLSGGQAQRVAVARALAGRRRLLFLDEPSVGLDPHRVRMLARLLRRQVRELGVSAVVITHDVALAAGVADRLYLLDPDARRLAPLFPGEWPGPREEPGVSEEERGAWLLRLEGELCAALARGERAAEAERPRPGSRRRGRAAAAVLAPFSGAAAALAALPAQLFRRPRDFVRIARRVFAQALLRPLPFYAIVAILVGYTVLYVISRVGGAGVRPDALVRQIGGSYVVALAPALSAMLFVAASGSAVNAWLGSMGLTRQTLALEALGIRRQAYLFAPAWLALGLAYLAIACVFAAGMIAGGLVLCWQLGLEGGFALLTADLLDPRPERAASALRAGFLLWVYAWGIASDVVARGGADKREADDVTRGMTASVVACTLWIVAWELASVLVLLR